MNRYPRHIRFEMSNRTSFTLPRDKAEAIMASPQQLIRVTDENGEWTGEVINKAHIVDTKPDWLRQDDEIEPQLRALDGRIAELSPRADAGEIARLREERHRLWLGRPVQNPPLHPSALPYNGKHENHH
jgi:hypothetical protein